MATEALLNLERKDAIIRLIEADRRVTVTALSDRFGVSQVTIRRDLKELEEAGLVRRTYGGAVQPQKSRLERTNLEKLAENRAEKAAIGARAAAMVSDGDTVVLDSGTTCLELAKHLDHHRDLTVVVNDLAIAVLLAANDGVTLIVTGGLVRPGLGSMVGPLAALTLGEVNVDKAFIAANGVSPMSGVTTPDLHQAETKRRMIEAASEAIVVADASKIGAVSFATVAPLARFDKLVTDQRIPRDDLRRLEESGLMVIVAENEQT